MSIIIYHENESNEVDLEPLPSSGSSAQVAELEKRLELVEATIGKPDETDKLDGGTF